MCDECGAPGWITTRRTFRPQRVSDRAFNYRLEPAILHFWVDREGTITMWWHWTSELPI